MHFSKTALRLRRPQPSRRVPGCLRGFQRRQEQSESAGSVFQVARRELFSKTQFKERGSKHGATPSDPCSDPPYTGASRRRAGRDRLVVVEEKEKRRRALGNTKTTCWDRSMLWWRQHTLFGIEKCCEKIFPIGRAKTNVYVVNSAQLGAGPEGREWSQRKAKGSFRSFEIGNEAQTNARAAGSERFVHLSLHGRNNFSRP